MKFKMDATVEAHFHLQKLMDYQLRIEATPGICSVEIAPAAMDWLSGEIDQLSVDLFGKKEKAAPAGDDFLEQRESMFVFSIPSPKREHKGESA